MDKTILEQSQTLLHIWTLKEIQDFIPLLVAEFEKLDYEADKIEIEYDLYKIERYEYWKKKKKTWEKKRKEKEIEIEAKKDALKKYWDQLLWKKIAQHYKLNIDQLSQRKIDIATENKNMREAGL